MNNTLRFLLLIFFIAVLWHIGSYFHLDESSIEELLVDKSLFYSGIAFVILYVIVTFFIWLSKDLFRFIAALLFGPYISTLFILIAEIINAFILFHLASGLGRGFVEEFLKAKEKSRLQKKISNFNFFWLFLLRATPLAPFRFLDLTAGLGGISFKKYIAAVIVGSPLRIFWVQYVLFGVGKSVLSNPWALSEYILQNKGLFTFSILYLFIVVVVALKIKSKERR